MFALYGGRMKLSKIQCCFSDNLYNKSGTLTKGFYFLLSWKNLLIRRRQNNYATWCQLLRIYIPLFYVTSIKQGRRRYLSFKTIQIYKKIRIKIRLPSYFRLNFTSISYSDMSFANNKIMAA
jgi:hypothetical protein